MFLKVILSLRENQTIVLSSQFVTVRDKTTGRRFVHYLHNLYPANIYLSYRRFGTTAYIQIHDILCKTQNCCWQEVCSHVHRHRQGFPNENPLSRRSITLPSKQVCRDLFLNERAEIPRVTEAIKMKQSRYLKSIIIILHLLLSH